MSDMNHKAVYQFLSRFLTEERRQLFERMLSMRTRYLTVVLEEIYHPHNMNAVLRTCDCFGLAELHVVEGKYRFDTSPRISRGAGKWVRVRRHSNVHDAVTEIAKEGYILVASSPERQAIPIGELPIDRPIALLFGAEKEGVSEASMRASNFRSCIPMQGFTESLNVSVATAVCLYELTNRIRSSDLSWSLSESEADHLRVEWALKSVRSPDMLMSHFLKETS